MENTNTTNQLLNLYQDDFKKFNDLNYNFQNNVASSKDVVESSAAWLVLQDNKNILGTDIYNKFVKDKWNANLLGLIQSNNEEIFIQQYIKLNPLEKRIALNKLKELDVDETIYSVADALYQQSVLSSSIELFKKLNPDKVKQIIQDLKSKDSLTSYALTKAIIHDPFFLDKPEALKVFNKIDNNLKQIENEFGDIFSSMTDDGIKFVFEVYGKNKGNLLQTYKELLDLDKQGLLNDSFFTSSDKKKDILTTLESMYNLISKDKPLEDAYGPDDLILDIGIAGSFKAASLMSKASVDALVSKIPTKALRKPIGWFLNALRVDHAGTRQLIEKYGVPLYFVSNKIAEQNLLLGLATAPELSYGFVNLISNIGKSLTKGMFKAGESAITASKSLINTIDKTNLNIGLIKTPTVIDIGKQALDSGNIATKNILGDYIGNNVYQYLVNPTKDIQNKIQKLVGTDVHYLFVNSQKEIIENPAIGEDITIVLKQVANNENKIPKVFQLNAMFDLDKGQIKLILKDNNPNVLSYLEHAANLKGNILSVGSSVQDVIGKAAASIFGDDVKKSIYRNAFLEFKSLSEQLVKNPNNEELLDKFFDAAGNALDYMLEQSSGIHNNIDELYDLFEKSINNKQGIVGNLFQRLKYTFLSPFVKDERVYKALVDDVSILEDLNHQFNVLLEKPIIKVIKSLSRKDKAIVNRLLLEGDKLGKEWDYSKLIANYGQKVADAYRTVNIFYKKMRIYFDEIMSNHFGKQNIYFLDNKPVYLIRDYIEDGIKKAVVKDPVTKQSFTIPKSNLKLFNQLSKDIKGYIPRIPDGDIVVSIVDVKNLKVKKSIYGVKNIKEIKDLANKDIIDIKKQFSGLRGLDEARILSSLIKPTPDLIVDKAGFSLAGKGVKKLSKKELKTLKESAYKQKYYRIIIHHSNENPREIAFNLFSKSKEMPLLSKKIIQEHEDLYKQLKQAGYSDEDIEIILQNINNKEIADFFAQIGTSTGRLFNRVKGNVDEFTVHYLNRKDPLDATREYIRTINRYTGFARYRDELKNAFIKKYKHLLEEIDGIVDWRYFKEDAIKSKDYYTARLLQNHLRRLYNVVPRNVEIVANVVNNIYRKRAEAFLKKAGISKAELNLNMANKVENVNKLLSFIGGSTRFFLDIAQVPLQASQSIITLTSNLEVAPKVLQDTTEFLLYYPFKRFYSKATKLPKKFQEIYDDLLNSGIIARLVPEEIIGGQQYLDKGLIFLKIGEGIQRVVAGVVAREKAIEAGLTKGTKEYYKFIHDYGTKFALNLGNQSKSTLTEGVFSWNIGQFKRYFAQMIDLFYNRLTPRQQLLTGVALFELYGLSGIPLVADAKDLYSSYETNLRYMYGNLLMMLDRALEESPKDILDDLLNEGYLTKNEYRKALTVLSKDIEALKTNYESKDYPISNYNAAKIEDIAKDAKDTFEVINKIMEYKGALDFWKGRLAFEGFFTKMYDYGVSSVFGSIVKALVDTGKISYNALFKAKILDNILDNKAIYGKLPTNSGNESEDFKKKSAVVDFILKETKAVAPAVGKLSELFYAYSMGKIQKQTFEEMWDSIDGVNIESLSGNALVKDAGIKDYIKYYFGFDLSTINPEKKVGYDVNAFLIDIGNIARDLGKQAGKMVADGDKRALAFETKIHLLAKANGDSSLVKYCMSIYNRAKNKAIKEAIESGSLSKTKLYNLAKELQLITDDEYNEYMQDIIQQNQQ